MKNYFKIRISCQLGFCLTILTLMIIACGGNDDSPSIEINSDADGDGIIDSEDNCPNLIGVAQFDGCPETINEMDNDGDGILNTQDECPDVAGTVSNNGCPIVNVDLSRYYVTPNGSGLMNGSSWLDASPGSDLQAIINNAPDGDEIWVSCGAYYPTTTTNRSVSFSMRNGISIYGSFQGAESSLNERELSCGPCSILSGEIGAAGISDNSYTVMWNEELDDTAIIDGFVIQDGNDNRSISSDGGGLGGGIYNHGYGSSGFCHPTIMNCVFTNNYASWGAGAFNNGYNGGDSEPKYINCIFYKNHAYIEAGGMDSYGVRGNASPTIINTLFYENTSDTNVGAMYAWGGGAGGNSHPVLINCAFINNTALNGYGGAFIANSLDENGTTTSGSCSVTLKNCIVRNNTATGVGPQFYIRGDESQVIATYSNIDMTSQSLPHIISGLGEGNINEDPLFNNIFNAIGTDECWMTSDDGLQLQNSSPSINTGDNTETFDTDITNSTRIIGSNVDMGPYEFIP